PRLTVGSRAYDAAEPQVGRRRVDRLGHAGSRPVAPAVVGGTQVGPTLDHAAGHGGGVAAVEAGLAGAASGIGHGAARVVGDRTGGVVLVPVGRPLPDVAAHLEQAVAVGRKGLGRRGVLPPVEHLVVQGELALPHVGHVAAARRELVAPGVLGALQPAAGRPLPLGLAGQVLAGPGGVGDDV